MIIKGGEYIMGDRTTLLAEIEVEKQKKIEKAFAEQKTKNASYNKKQKTINPFSSSAFPKNVVISESETEKEIIPEDEIENEEFIENDVETEIKNMASESSTIIEKPNYDMLEELSDEQRTQIFGDEKEDEKAKSKPKRNVFKMVMISVMFALFGVWGIVNLIQINSVDQQITQVSTEYGINYVSYLNNLHNLDATNSNNMENLFETINEDGAGVTNVKEQSNWFDRFCNFIGGLFGG